MMANKKDYGLIFLNNFMYFLMIFVIVFGSYKIIEIRNDYKPDFQISYWEEYNHLECNFNSNDPKYFTFCKFFEDDEFLFNLTRMILEEDKGDTLS